MEDPEELYLPEGNVSKVIEFPPEHEDSSPYETSRMWSLVPGAIYCLAGLAVLVILVLNLEPHRRNLLLVGTAAMLIFFFIFAALIVRSYNRDKEKLLQQGPHGHHRIIG